MSARDVGKKLVQLCQQGKNMESVQTLYHPEVESIEAAEMQGMQRVIKGQQAVQQKNQWWLDNHEIHSSAVQGPYPHGEDRFAVHYAMDITNKQSGQRSQLTEVGLYTVQDNKVVREEYFYDGEG